MNRTSKRTVVAIGLAIASFGVGAGTASADAGDPPNCLGTSVSTNTQTIHPYGQLVSLFAIATQGVGNEVAQIKAGTVDDSIYRNDCN